MKILKTLQKIGESIFVLAFMIAGTILLTIGAAAVLIVAYGLLSWLVRNI